MRIKLLLFLCTAIIFASCSKEEDITEEMNARLSFSFDSVLFDTVFTTVGSTSRRLKIYNPNEKAIVVSRIKLSGENISAYSLNINGQAASEVNLIKINGKDSINVFVKVNINSSDENLPFLVKDSILFDYNGQRKSIPLIAYGQNANFITNGTIKTNTTWDSKLPYVIYKSLTIEEDASLHIEPGSKILFHSNATMNIKGTLKVMGTKTDSVLFASDRLETFYAEDPGQWNGIHFYPKSKNSHINYAVIKNGIVGITADSLSVNDQPKLLLTNTIVKNMEVVGFLGYQTSLTGFNNLFYNCGQYLLYGVGGGKYNLKQNTFAGFNLHYARKTASVYLSDFISNTQQDHLTLDLQNNIIWGVLPNEFIVDKKSPATTLTKVIKNNLLRCTELSYFSAGNFLYTELFFVHPLLGNFNLNNNSPVLNKGIDLSDDPYFNRYLKRDMNDEKRLFPSDLGCYEKN
ncbi:hypothetical protein [Pedobacter insulae]|uniref:Right handed beta helix region n=1 Tax=Pedobacter insulae TaxID=414048 RepID=A0A1I2TFW5_9SPHI|nr:hypothetical protein [Pedobacter insulae]SFG62939.1 hypothetical protein SAMN04489864_101344 [Pedobacter insulae]